MRFIKSLFLVAVLAAVVVPNAMAFRFTDEARNTPTGVTGQAYNHPLSFAGGCNLVTVFIGPGSLPPGLRVVGQPRDDSQNGWRIEGTPTQAGSFTFWINAKSGVPECQPEHDTTQEEWTMRIAPGLAIQARRVSRRHAERGLSDAAADRPAAAAPTSRGRSRRARCPRVCRSRRPASSPGRRRRSSRASRSGSAPRDSSGRSTVRNYELSIRAPLAVTVTPAQPPIAQIGQPFKFGPFVPTGGLGPTRSRSHRARLPPASPSSPRQRRSRARRRRPGRSVWSSGRRMPKGAWSTRR